MNPARLLARLAAGNLRNVTFRDFCKLLEAFEFRLARITGSHHIYQRPGVIEQLNVQDVGGEAKPYQIRQFLRLVERYGLRLEDEK